MSALPELIPTSALPLKKAALGAFSASAAARVVAAHRASGTADGAYGPVLLIEPDDALRALLTAGLSRAGFEVVACKTVRAALLALEPTCAVPSLVLAEVALSPMDGFCLCEQLRGEMRTAHVPVLLLAHAPTAEQEELARIVGAEDLLARPVSVEDVVTLAQLETGPRTASDVRSSAAGALAPVRLVSALLAGRRSGTVGFGPGRALHFGGGRVVGATCDTLEGLPALKALLDEGPSPLAVRFGPGEDAPTLSVTRLELTRLAEHTLTGGSDRHLPLLSKRLVPELRTLRTLEGGLTEAERSLVGACDGRRSLAEALEAQSLAGAVSLSDVARLLELGALAEAATSALELAEARWRTPHRRVESVSARVESPASAGSLSQVIHLHLARQPQL